MRVKCFLWLFLLVCNTAFGSQDAVSLFKDERYTEANEIFKETADYNKVSQYFLGISYLNGLGVDKDIERGKYYIKRSAQQGFALSHLAMMKIFLNGDGVEQNVDMAFVWLYVAQLSGAPEDMIRYRMQQFEDYFVAKYSKDEFVKTKIRVKNFAQLCVDSNYQEDCFDY